MDEILQVLRNEGVAGASALHGVAGFNGRNPVHRASLVAAGGDLPVLVIFVDFVDHVDRVLPKLFALAPHRLDRAGNVQLEQGNLD